MSKDITVKISFHEGVPFRIWPFPCTQAFNYLFKAGHEWNGNGTGTEKTQMEHASVKTLFLLVELCVIVLIKALIISMVNEKLSKIFDFLWKK